MIGNGSLSRQTFETPVQVALREPLLSVFGTFGLLGKLLNYVASQTADRFKKSRRHIRAGHRDAKLLLDAEHERHSFNRVQANAVSQPRCTQIPHPLHPDVEFVVESGGALVSRDYRQADSLWQFPQRPGIDCCNRRLPEMSQPKPSRFRLESFSG